MSLLYNLAIHLIGLVGVQEAGIVSELCESNRANKKILACSGIAMHTVITEQLGSADMNNSAIWSSAS